MSKQHTHTTAIMQAGWDLPIHTHLRVTIHWLAVVRLSLEWCCEAIHFTRHIIISNQRKMTNTGSELQKETRFISQDKTIITQLLTYSCSYNGSMKDMNFAMGAFDNAFNSGVLLWKVQCQSGRR